jgi:hypothetical protein
MRSCDKEQRQAKFLDYDSGGDTSAMFSPRPDHEPSRNDGTSVLLFRDLHSLSAHRRSCSRGRSEGLRIPSCPQTSPRAQSLCSAARCET